MVKRNRMSDSAESQSLHWYLQSSTDSSNDGEWEIRRFNSPDSIAHKDWNRQTPDYSIHSSSMSSYIDRHPEEFKVIVPKLKTKLRNPDINWSPESRQTKQTNHIHEYASSTSSTSDYIFNLLYLSFFIFGVNNIKTVIDYLKSKLWTFTHLRSQSSTNGKTSLNQRRSKRRRQRMHSKRFDITNQVISSITLPYFVERGLERILSLVSILPRRTKLRFDTCPDDSCSKLVTLDDTSSFITSTTLQCIQDPQSSNTQSQPPFLRDEGMSSFYGYSESIIGNTLSITQTPKFLNGTDSTTQAVDTFVGHMGYSAIALPTTQLLKENIEVLSSVFSSSGLNHQTSLQIATQTVIRKLEIDYKYKTKLSMKAHLRMEDRLIEENKQLSQQLENAHLKLRQTAYSLFPGNHFLLCTLLSALSHMSRYYLNYFIHGQLPRINLAATLDYIIIEVLCDCRKNNTRINPGPVYDVVRSRYLSISSIPTISSIIYYYAPSSSCLVPCVIRTLCITFIIAMTHWIFHKLYVPFYIHQCLNTAIFVVVMSRLVTNSYLSILGGVALTNIAIALIGFAVSLRYDLRDKLQTSYLALAVKALDRNIFLMLFTSTLMAIFQGFLM